MLDVLQQTNRLCLTRICSYLDQLYVGLELEFLTIARWSPLFERLRFTSLRLRGQLRPEQFPRNLTELNLSGINGLNPKYFLAYLDGLRELLSLSINGLRKLQPVHMQEVAAKLPALQRLSMLGLYKCHHLGFLREFTRLEFLSLDNVGLTGQAQVSLPPRLRELVVRNPSQAFLRGLLQHQASGRFTSRLQFSDRQADLHLDLVASIENLLELDIHHQAVPSSFTACRMATLRRLNLNDSQVTDEALSVVAVQALSLVELELKNCAVTDRVISLLPDSLRVLNVEGCANVSAGVLHCCPQLEVLNLGGGAADRGRLAVAVCGLATGLHSLSVAGHHLPDWSALARLRLSYLNIDRCPSVLPADLAWARTSATLRKISATSCLPETQRWLRDNLPSLILRT